MSNWDLKIDWKGEGGRESSDYFFILFSDQNQLIFGGKKKKTIRIQTNPNSFSIKYVISKCKLAFFFLLSFFFLSPSFLKCK